MIPVSTAEESSIRRAISLSDLHMANQKSMIFHCNFLVLYYILFSRYSDEDTDAIPSTTTTEANATAQKQYSK